MSVAVSVDAVDTKRSGVAERIVVVRDFGFAHCTATCTCGWTGRRRYLKAAAEQDAWMHSIHEQCAVAVPLVQPGLAS